MKTLEDGKVLTDDEECFVQVNWEDEIYYVEVDSPLAYFLKMSDEEFAEYFKL